MKIYELGFIAIMATAIAGCSKTVEGLKEDARADSINASKTIKEGFDNGAKDAKNAAIQAKEASKNLGAAVSLTPRIKNAINADSRLNDDKNVIDVDSTKETVTISGHVSRASLKDLVGRIAKEELTKAGADQKLINNLVVEAPKT